MSPTLPKRAVFGISQCGGITRLEQPRASPGHPARRRTRRKAEPSTLRISTNPYDGPSHRSDKIRRISIIVARVLHRRKPKGR
jgi:hypothetical protein